MNLHLSKLEDGFADSIGIPMELLVWTTEDDLIEELADELVPFLEAIVPALGTAAAHFAFTCAAQSLVALYAVLGISHQVEAHWAGQSLFKEFVLILSISSLIHEIEAVRC